MRSPSPTRVLPALALALLGWGCGRGDGDRPADAAPLSPEALARPAADAGSSLADPADIPADAPRVIFLGDSISAGLHLEPAQAFPALVQRLLLEEGHPFHLVNAGVSGDTSAGGLRRLDWILKQEPDVLVVELGGNDGLRGQPVAEIEARLRQIVTRAQAAGARVLLLGVRLPPSLGAEYTDAFAALYAHLAKELGCALVPSFMDGTVGVPGNMLDDGIHPSSAGHARIADNVAPALHALLEH
jgi:acyl-CoA thioesterase I